MRHSALIFILIAACQPAWAGLYKWVDEKGVTHYGDTMPPAAAKQGTSELNKRGMTIKRTDRALTEEEIKAQEAEAAKKKEEEQKELEHKRRDRALLESFTSEKEIDLSRDRNIQAIQNYIDSAEVRLKAAQAHLDRANGQAVTIKSNKRPVPADVTADIKAAEKEVKEVQEDIAKFKQDIADTRARFEEDKKRFRELKGLKGQQPK